MMKNWIILSLAAKALADVGRTTEAEEASITDITAECAPYDFAPVDAIVSNI